MWIRPGRHAVLGPATTTPISLCLYSVLRTIGQEIQHALRGKNAQQFILWMKQVSCKNERPHLPARKCGLWRCRSERSLWFIGMRVLWLRGMLSVQVVNCRSQGGVSETAEVSRVRERNVSYNSRTMHFRES